MDSPNFEISQITLDNFKCFSSWITIGPFQSLNCIVGPNGTGKSTILEALSFVLCRDLIIGGKFDYQVI